MWFEASHIFNDCRVPAEGANPLLSQCFEYLYGGELQLLSADLEHADPVVYKILQNVC